MRPITVDDRLDEQFSGPHNGLGDGAQDVAVVYGAAFGFGLLVAMFSAVGGMPGLLVHLSKHEIQLVLVLPALSALSSAVIARIAGRSDGSRIPWPTVLLVGGALGAVCGFVCSLVWLYSHNGFSDFGGFQSLQYASIGAISGVPVGMLSASVLARLLKTSHARRGWAPVMGGLLGALVGAALPTATLYVLVRIF
jgi:hypothetical protein